MAATGTTPGPVTQPTVDGTPPGMAARANQTRRPSPAGFDPSFGKSSVEIAGELGRGAKDGIVDLAADAARLDLLHVPRGLAHLVRSAWSSGGGLGGLVSVVLEPGRAQVAAAVDRAAEGDFRGAAAAGVKAIGVAVTTGIAVGELGAAAVDAVQESRPSGLQPGPRAGGSIPARGPERDFTKDERVQINEIGRDSGCHTCGSTEPGTKSGNFIPDHQPPTRLAPPGTPQRLFPHCRSCSLRQGGEVNGELTRK
jgi:hypothetical protein